MKKEKQKFNLGKPLPLLSLQHRQQQQQQHPQQQTQRQQYLVPEQSQEPQYIPRSTIGEQLSQRYTEIRRQNQPQPQLPILPQSQQLIALASHPEPEPERERQPTPEPQQAEPAPLHYPRIRQRYKGPIYGNRTYSTNPSYTQERLPSYQTEQQQQQQQYQSEEEQEQEHEEFNYSNTSIEPIPPSSSKTTTNTGFQSNGRIEKSILSNIIRPHRLIRSSAGGSIDSRLKFLQKRHKIKNDYQQLTSSIDVLVKREQQLLVLEKKKEEIYNEILLHDEKEIGENIGEGNNEWEV